MNEYDQKEPQLNFFHHNFITPDSSILVVFYFCHTLQNKLVICFNVFDNFSTVSLYFNNQELRERYMFWLFKQKDGWLDD